MSTIHFMINQGHFFDQKKGKKIPLIYQARKARLCGVRAPREARGRVAGRARGAVDKSVDMWTTFAGIGRLSSPTERRKKPHI